MKLYATDSSGCSGVGGGGVEFLIFKPTSCHGVEGEVITAEGEGKPTEGFT
jgi:hypothetical protein